MKALCHLPQAAAWIIPAFLHANAWADQSMITVPEERKFESDIQARAEVEAYENQNWVPAADDAYYYQRIILNTEWRPFTGLAVVAAPIHAWAWGKDVRTPIDMNRLDFLQLAINWEITDTHSLHLGRQILDFGSGRLVSSRMGPNVPRSFDAVRYVWRPDPLVIQFFYAREVLTEPGAFDDPVFNKRNTLWGVHSTWNIGGKNGIDLYALGTEMADDRISSGMRYHGASGPFKWDLEGILQFGDGIRAGSIASTLSYEIHGLSASPRLGLKTSISSGDRDSTSRNETFSPLYPRGDYFSETATVGPLNHMELHWFIDFDLGERTQLLVETASLWKTRKEDAVYSVPGAVLRGGNAGGGRFTGQETSISLTHSFTGALSAELSGSWFHAGSAVRDAGPADDMFYGKISVGYRF